MKALTIKQPWASLIVENIKNIENRTWKTNFRGRVYVHASKPTKFNVSLTDEQTIASLSVFKDAMDGNMSFGAIIGEVDIVDCVVNHPSIWAEKTEMPAGVYMGEKIIYNWVLANPIKYDQPILNVKGALSFWQPELP
jgi:hypothetical protein